MGHPITEEDIFAYLGVMIVMGLIKLPAISDYWSPISLQYHMTRDRFLEIHRFLHFVNNSTLPSPSVPSYDRLCKVRHFITLIQDGFVSLYNPHCQCAVDEAMIKYKDRSSLKQYMPMKPMGKSRQYTLEIKIHRK